MKLDYEYIVQNIGPDGYATVEYKCKELGSITRVFFIPYEQGEALVRQTIIERFPYQLFYSRYHQRSKLNPESALIKGKMSVDFTDYFYSLQVQTAETLSLNEEENH